MQLDVLGEQVFQPCDVAFTERGEEPVGQPLALFGRALEARPARLDSRRARLASWRALAALVPTISAISSKR